MISLRSSNVIAIFLAIVGFYLNLRGITPTMALKNLSTRMEKASEDTSQLVNNMMEANPEYNLELNPKSWSSDSQPVMNSSPSPRLIRHTKKSDAEKSRLNVEMP